MTTNDCHTGPRQAPTFFARRFTSRVQDLDVDFGNTDRPTLAARIVAECLLGDTLYNEAEVLGWTVAKRLQGLLSVAVATFGNVATWRFKCQQPDCRQSMEMALQLDQLLPGPADEERFEWFPENGVRLGLRLPTGINQQRWRSLCVAEAELPHALATTLVETIDGEAPPPGWILPKAWLAGLETQMAGNDPSTPVPVEIECPWCGSQTITTLDPEALVLDLMAGEQRLAMEDVERLAARYHWNEVEVLAIPPQRRAFYASRQEAVW